MNLRHRIHGYADHDQQTGSSKIKRHLVSRNQKFRKQTDKNQIQRAHRSYARQHVIEVIRRVLARTNARNKAAVFAQHLRIFLGIKYDRSVKEAKECDQKPVENHVDRLAVLQVTRHIRPEIPACRPGEPDHRQGQQQQRRSENRRYHARGIEP